MAVIGATLASLYPFVNVQVEVAHGLIAAGHEPCGRGAAREGAGQGVSIGELERSRGIGYLPAAVGGACERDARGPGS